MYQSTRGRQTVHASDAIMKGIASDGGLFSMVDFPKASFLSRLHEMDYLEISKSVLAYFLDDFNKDEINTLVNQAYSFENFPNQIVQLEEIGNDDLLTLYHGPTFAFKDMALTIFSSLYSLAKKKQGENRRTIILSATSGDTGSAVLNGFKNDLDTEIIIFYPHQRISPFQKKQMHFFENERRHVIAIEGNFDDCQSLIKTGFEKIELQHSIFSSANSINIARIIPQVIYYFWSYGELLRRRKIQYTDSINFVVPTGNFGNILAGYYAKKMGLFIHQLVVSSNQNNVLTDFFRQGIYNKNRPFIETTSPSMDILVSSNLERLLFEVSDHDTSFVKEKMEELKVLGRYQIQREKYPELTCFYSAYLNESEVLSQIKKTYREYGKVVDPHTAVGIGCLSKYRLSTGDKTTSVVLSTASPLKFASSVLKGLGRPSPMTDMASYEMMENDFGFRVDQRAHSFLQVEPMVPTWKKENAFENLKKMVGELDV
ncbi:MAG: threonine synthase [Firmicutes bacterium]|nr:threonine synthase [Bacillota bacterium]